MDHSHEPSSAQLEGALRDEVARLFELDDMENLTLRRVRAVAEEKFELVSGWFKRHEEWNQKSKDIVTDQLKLSENRKGDVAASDEEESPVRGSKAFGVPPKNATKRKPSRQSPQLPKKQRKEDVQSPAKSPSKPETGDESSSLSEVLDPSPPPKQKRGKTSKDKPLKAATSKAGRSSTKPKKQAKSTGNNLSTEDAQIRSLQSWLVKCGVRKLWGKELSRFESPAEKIDHLKEMLRDVGMDGRYSDEKAKKIKEARELAADLEDIQQGEKSWGTNADEQRRPGRRRLSRAPLAAPAESSASSEEQEVQRSDPANNVSNGSDMDDE